MPGDPERKMYDELTYKVVGALILWTIVTTIAVTLAATVPMFVHTTHSWVGYPVGYVLAALSLGIGHQLGKLYYNRRLAQVTEIQRMRKAFWEKTT